MKWTDEHIDREFDRLWVEIHEFRREMTAEIRARRADINQLKLWMLGAQLTMALAIAGAYLH